MTARVVLDPTGERSPATRQRVDRPASLEGRTIGENTPALPTDATGPHPSTGPISITPCAGGCKASGSIIDVHNQSLSEELPITGTPFSWQTAQKVARSSRPLCTVWCEMT